MSSGQELLSQYEGEFVPRSFRPAFVVLSYVVSCVGATSTLELLNRRTSRNGPFNFFVLASAAIAMGGISVWCMHFLGNHAIILGQGEPELRIDFSSGLSALSFFLPIIVLLAAFAAIGASYKISWWRICCGGLLAGLGISGMHYMGNASISNYDCVYENVFIAGAVVIALVYSIVALSIFFAFRASWRNSWQKRMLSALLLAAAVSGMHWVATAGTKYRLIRLNDHPKLSQTHLVILVVCLSIFTALFLAGFVTYAAWITRCNARKAQQIILAAAVFDNSGRMLVSRDGSLPSEKITDTYVERSHSDIFNISHPLFHWMFQVSRNWNSVAGIVHGMANHLARLPRGSRDAKIRLIDDDGEPIENYDAIFRELFCVAAVNLAGKLKEQLIDVGILWDDILATGADELPRKLSTGDGFTKARGGRGFLQQEYGRGSLMFLVRRIERRQDIERLEGAGFRFAEPHQVCGIIRSRMQIKTRDLRGKLASMATLAGGNTLMERGVHLGLFGVRARVGSFGFDVVAKKGARNLLPSMPVCAERLEPWQMDVVRRLDRMEVPLLFQNLDALKKLSPREVLFASQLSDALQALRAFIDDAVFDESVLTSKVVRVPCRPRPGSNSADFCTMIALCIMMPIHARTSSPRCEFVPLNFFKIHQMAYKNSPHLAVFARYVHRELSPTVNAVPISLPQSTYQRISRAVPWRNRVGPLRRLGHSNANRYAMVGDGSLTSTELGRKSPSYDSDQSGSLVELRDDIVSDKTGAHQLSSFGGIMVSQEIQVDIRQIDDVSGSSSAALKSPMTTDRVTMVKAGAGFDFSMDALPGGAEEDVRAVAEREKINEVITFVDELFAICVDGL